MTERLEFEEVIQGFIGLKYTRKALSGGKRVLRKEGAKLKKLKFFCFLVLFGVKFVICVVSKQIINSKRHRRFARL